MCYSEDADAAVCHVWSDWSETTIRLLPQALHGPIRKTVISLGKVSREPRLDR